MREGKEGANPPASKKTYVPVPAQDLFFDYQVFALWERQCEKAHQLSLRLPDWDLRNPKRRFLSFLFSRPGLGAIHSAFCAPQPCVHLARIITIVAWASGAFFFFFAFSGYPFMDRTRADRTEALCFGPVAVLSFVRRCCAGIIYCTFLINP